MNAHPYLIRKKGNEGKKILWKRPRRRRLFFSLPLFLTTNKDAIRMEMNEHHNEGSDGKLKVI
jgi:hypothetical protein